MLMTCSTRIHCGKRWSWSSIDDAQHSLQRRLEGAAAWYSLHCSYRLRPYLHGGCYRTWQLTPPPTRQVARLQSSVTDPYLRALLPPSSPSFFHFLPWFVAGILAALVCLSSDHRRAGSR